MKNAELLAGFSKITEEEQAILEGDGLDKSIYTDQGGFTIDNKKMLRKSKLITLRPHTRFIDFPNHNHNYIEIMYVCQGSITHLINGTQAITLQPGELLFMSCQTYHRIQKAGEQDLAVNFIVLPQFFDKAYEMLDHDNVLSQFISQNLRGNGGQISHLHYQVADVLPIQNLVENLMLDILAKQPGSHNICSLTMGLLFLQLLNVTERIQTGALEQKLVIAVLREIEENYRAASLSHIAETHHQSVYALSKLVKQVTGRTYKELLQEKRFSKALQLLDTTRLPVADIALYVGYENTSYFHRRFQERFHLTPAAYRAQSGGK